MTKQKEPKYDLILLELNPTTKINWDLIKKTQKNLVAIRTIKKVPDSYLRSRFWPLWENIIQEIIDYEL